MSEPSVQPLKPGCTRVALQFPVTLDGLTCAHLDLRRPKVRDQLHAEKSTASDSEKEIAMFASLAGVAPKLIEELDMADYIAVQQTVQGFLPKPAA